MTKGIITITGKDKVGIIGNIAMLLSNEGVNILDISQTLLLDEWFNMFMVVDLDNNKIPFDELVEKLKECEKNIGIQIRLQHEDIFNCMHRV